ncbi:hypothetical protein LXA43DRAFT_1027668 [Ganoderma leucocontextum]|nr:hypothetical protein LXA43DRAFT_1027668 [Ganoderma leucocontextum]
MFSVHSSSSRRIYNQLFPVLNPITNPSHMPAPDILTFRLNKGNNNFCYVVPPQSFEDGIRAAKDNFEELRHVDPTRITICVNALVANQRQHIRVSPASWPIVVAKLRPYEVLDIIVHPSPIPDIVIHSEDGIEKLPRYEDIRDKTGSDDFLAPSRHSSPQTIQRYSRRSPSPSPRSSHSKNSSSSSLTDIAKAIFGRGSSQ